MKKSNKKNKKNSRSSLVVGVDPSRYIPQDKRFMKPLCHQKYDNGFISGSMLLQELDSIKFTRNREATYFLPNNIALLLSTSEKALASAKEIYNTKLICSDFEINVDKIDGDRKKAIGEISSLICDYLENIQTAIVFGYTALEAFVNLSIPENYSYSTDKNNRGISETYDKKAIERWLSLKTKIKSILRDIYQTSKIDKQEWWWNFTNLEKYRNDIIHQKSIDSTEFYKLYFKSGIFNICYCPLDVIRFFYEAHAEKNKTNPIWPWLDDSNSIPVNVSYDSSQFEVVGNIHEGLK